MADRADLAKALSIVETAVQDMAAAGLDPMKRAVALAFHMQRQVDIAIPDATRALALKVSLATTN